MPVGQPCEPGTIGNMLCRCFCRLEIGHSIPNSLSVAKRMPWRRAVLLFASADSDQRSGGGQELALRKRLRLNSKRSINPPDSSTMQLQRSIPQARAPKNRLRSALNKSSSTSDGVRRATARLRTSFSSSLSSALASNRESPASGSSRIPVLLLTAE